MHKFMDRLFGGAEEINGHNRCPTYLYRWTLLATRWGKIYLHKFVGDDWSRDLHDHPKRFVSIGIVGSYIEETPTGEIRYRSPWIRSFAATHQHRIRMTEHGKTCWTIVFVGKLQRDWGFWHDGQWHHWKSYVEERGGIADKMKACD